MKITLYAWPISEITRMTSRSILLNFLLSVTPPLSVKQIFIHLYINVGKKKNRIKLKVTMKHHINLKVIPRLPPSSARQSCRTTIHCLAYYPRDHPEVAYTCTWSVRVHCWCHLFLLFSVSKRSEKYFEILSYICSIAAAWKHSDKCVV